MNATDPSADPAPPWYADGLRFACTRCGRCCTGTPGFVWVGEDEIVRLAEAMGLPLDDFGRRYLRRVGDRLSLVEKPNHECAFWEPGQGCTVYEFRPDQCRSWPFWAGNVETPADWERTAGFCPGSGEGRLYTVEEIGAAVARGPES